MDASRKIQPQVSAKVEGDVGYLTLNRQNVLNALSPSMLESICEGALWLSKQREMRVCIVNALGRAFSAGADLPEFTSLTGSELVRAVDLGRNAAEAVEAIPVITICAIQGWCVGGGLVIAAACDLRVAEHDACFSIPEINIGIPLAWSGVPRLLREIGPARAKELIATGRRFDALEAERIGFLNKTVSHESLGDHVLELAKQIARKPIVASKATKAHVNELLEEMVSTRGSWRDAGALASALLDSESVQARDAYAQSSLSQKP